MFQYNVLEKGTPGGGGEYNVQIGFGWSNGVVLEILNKYGQMNISADFAEKYFFKEKNIPKALLVGVSVGSIVIFCVMLYLVRKFASYRRHSAYRRMMRETA